MADSAVVNNWIDDQPAYTELRAKLVRLENDWQKPVARYALRQLDLVWDEHRSILDFRLQGQAFFGLYQEEDFKRQMMGMILDSERAHYGNTGHHVTYTVSGIWDALSRYSVSEGWGSLDPQPRQPDD